MAIRPDAAILFPIDTSPLRVEDGAMEALTVLSAAAQVAEHLKKELRRGGLRGTLPGVAPLAEELGVNHKTVRAALDQLEKEGLVESRGNGLGRRVALADGRIDAPALRVALLLFDPMDHGEHHIIELRHRLELAGHLPFFVGTTLQELRMDADRVARFVRRTEADAWIVAAGSREVLEWFSGQELPAFALFGRMADLPLAGAKPNKPIPMAELSRRLIALGHSRISLLCRQQLRQPQPGTTPRTFLGELKAAGITTGPFNLPDWEESREGFERLLDSLFSATPPTALILDEPFLFHAAYHHLSGMGLRIPHDVSLACTDADPGFAWCQPPVSHIRWDDRPVVHRIVRWANNIARGKDDRRQTLTRAEFIEGGTIGPAPTRPRG